MMPLDSYPFSERFAWVQDRYGLSWQLYFNSDSPVNQVITPSLMFSGAGLGKAEAAMEYYAGVFAEKGESGVGNIARYGAENTSREGMVMHGAFTLLGQEFYAMDSHVDNDHPFNEAISFMVHCDTQEEIDYFWNKLSAVPEAEQCGWLKDKFGLSWQIVPTAMMEMLKSGDEGQIARVTQAFLQMKKFDIATLERAAAGEG
jgi:predicted 3-demethylubiquinone-9 3-methyltransferase (glyoxalase superfamily)